MFYAHFVLAKKGPLARIWLAAHWDKKLTKAHVFETNIQKSVEDILHPKVKIALRTSGHLLLGVVRIYSRKAKYLLADCNEAFVKIKMAFRPGMVDLPEENREAAVHAITLPEVFHDFDANVPDLNDAEMQAQFTMNQSRAEEITMREDYGCQLPPLSHDDEGFGDIGFGDSAPLELIRDGTSMEHSLEPGSFFGDIRERSEPRKNRLSTRIQSGSNTPVRDDGFGGNLTSDIIGGGLFEGGGLFDDAPIDDVPSLNEPSDLEKDTQAKDGLGDHLIDNDSDDERMDAFDAPPSVGGSSDSSRPGSPFGIKTGSSRSLLPPKSPLHKHDQGQNKENADLQISDKGGMESSDAVTVAHNEDDGFALAPLDVTAVKGWARHKRKRKLIIDEVKNISGEEMKAQLSDTSDIVTTLDLAPPTRRLMHWKETGGVEKLFALPGRPIPARLLFKDYQRHLTSQPTESDDFGLTVDLEKETFTSENARNADHSETFRHEISDTLKIPKRTQGKKRKALSELDHEAEDHLKQRELQYQSLLASSSLVSQEKLPEVTCPDAGNNSSVPSLMEPEALQLDSTYQDAASTSFSVGNAAHSAPEMENMGYQASIMPLETDDGFGGLPMATPGLVSERAPPTPWHDDYDMAPSVGPVEEQLADETYEQFEERVLNKRASAMYSLVKAKLQLTDSINLTEIIARCNKKQVAQKFYTLLVLKKNQAVELDQTGCYAEIMISRGRKFESPSL